TTVPADTYTIRAQAAGFVTGQLNNVVVLGNTTAPDLILQTQPAQSISGTVTSGAPGGGPVSGAKVELFQANGVTPTGITTTTAANGTYTLANVVAGLTYVVKVSRSGFAAAQRSVSVPLGAPVTGVNFVLTPAFFFQPGLYMVSPPDDYPGQDPRLVFGNPVGFNMAKFVPTGLGSGTYVLYPTPPATEVRAGRGQFVRIGSGVAFTAAGNVTPPGNFAVPLQTGWQLIGSARDKPVQFLNIQVRSGSATLTMRQA